MHGGFSFPFETLERIEQFRLTLCFNESLRMVKQWFILIYLADCKNTPKEQLSKLGGNP